MQQRGRTTAADLLKHAGALYPLPLPTVKGGGGGQSYSLEAPAEPEAGAQAAVSISESRGRGHPGTQASQKYTQIAEEINIPPNGASSAVPLPSTLGLSFDSSVPAGLCALLSPRNKTHRPGPLLPSLSLHVLSAGSLSLAGPAAETSRLDAEKSKGWMLLCLFRRSDRVCCRCRQNQQPA